MIDNISRWSRWLGYIVGILALAQIVIVSAFSLMSSPYYAEGDLIIAAGLSLSLILSLILARWWPFISGILLISAGLAVGATNAIIYIWVGIFYGLLPLIAGIAFLITGFCSWVEKKDSTLKLVCSTPLSQSLSITNSFD